MWFNNFAPVSANARNARTQDMRGKRGYDTSLGEEPFVYESQPTANPAQDVRALVYAQDQCSKLLQLAVSSKGATHSMYCGTYRYASYMILLVSTPQRDRSLAPTTLPTKATTILNILSFTSSAALLLRCLMLSQLFRHS